MEIKQVKISELKPYNKNNKIHNEKQIDLIAKSIKEFGYNQPLVIDGDYNIVVGHGRLEGSKKLGLETVPCIIKNNLTEKQIRKYRLLDNKLAELSEDNIENIKFELDEFQDLELNELYDINLDDNISNDFIGDLSNIDLPDINSNVVRGIMVPIKQEMYEECYKLFQEKLKIEPNIGELFFKMLKGLN